MQSSHGRQNKPNYNVLRAGQEGAGRGNHEPRASVREAAFDAPHNLTKLSVGALVGVLSICIAVLYFGGVKGTSTENNLISEELGILVPAQIAEMQALFGIDQPFMVMEVDKSHRGLSLQGDDKPDSEVDIITVLPNAGGSLKRGSMPLEAE